MSKSCKLSPVLVLLCLCLWQRHIAVAQNRIVGGVTTTIRAAPYLVNLRIDGEFYCGGSMVTRQHVVTAAHCVKGKKVRDIVVTAGTSQLNGSGVTRRVAKAFIPGNYRDSTKNVDVAVLKLQSPIRDSRVGTIGLCNKTLRVGHRIKIFGWGAVKENATIGSNQLRRVSVLLLNKGKCVRQYSDVTKLTKSMFCAAVPGKDSCSGDSGGPAVYGGRLCGIVSFGLGCARPNFPGVYTSVRRVSKFIRNSMRK